MSNGESHEPMLDLYIFETTQLIEQLEQNIINYEKLESFSEEAIDEIFRIMHTIKGSSSMMMFENISKLTHSLEDLFYLIRDGEIKDLDYSRLSDILLESIDFIKMEIEKIKDGIKPDDDIANIISEINSFLHDLKQVTQITASDRNKEQSVTEIENSLSVNNFQAVLLFEEDCQMETICALNIVQNLTAFTEEMCYLPEDLFDNANAVEIIRKEGFKIFLKTTKSYDEVHNFLLLTPFVKDCTFEHLLNDDAVQAFCQSKQNKNETFEAENNPLPSEKEIDGNKKDTMNLSAHQSIISVNVAKLDQLMDLVGELVISEAMVTQNPDLNGLSLESFQKSARQLKKITGELQDLVMSIRMVPLKATFQKLNRIVRDMSKKLGKEVRLEIIGEGTEVDKNIIEHISDPLMHIIRNSIDHGLESPEERAAIGKPEKGTVTLEAKNSGGDVLIIIKDDGRGLNREKILHKAKKSGLVNRPENELTDKEVFSYIFSPGFSTKDIVTEYSGRGVGMDVVVKNIGAVGGTVSVDSIPNRCTAITLKIPLTLTILDGMIIKVGKSTYTVPIINIRESFRAKAGDVITDPNGNEMIMVRGACHPVLRLHERFHAKTEITTIPDGIILMVESEEKCLCILADELLGEEQVVVKSLPDYIKHFNNASGLSGCTLLGDGSISLILDISALTC